MTMTKEIACVLLDNMKSKATELETNAIEFVLQIVSNEPQRNDNITCISLDKDGTRTYLLTEHFLNVTPNYVDKLFRRKGFPKKRIGKKYYVEPNELEKFLTKEKVL